MEHNTSICKNVGQNGVPMPTVAGGARTLPATIEGSTISLCEKVTAEDFAAYVTQLTENGFDTVSEYALGNNRYALMESGEKTVYVSYIAPMGTIRVYAEPKGVSKYPSAEQKPYKTVKGYEPAFWQLNIDHRHAEEFRLERPEGRRGAMAGQLDALQVADGSFILIDGGVHSDGQADILYHFLKKNSPHEKPVISAWLFTHAHGDHTGGYRKFVRRYADEVTVKAFYFNFTGRATFEENDITPFFPDAVVYKNMQAGMRYYIADAQLDVIYSYMDRYFAEVEITEQCGRWGGQRPLCDIAGDANNNTMVTRITHGGQRIMLLGDVEEEGSRIIEKQIDASELKSDIVQMAHHGWEGGTRELYDLIAAPTALWTNCFYSWQYDWFGGNVIKRLTKPSHSTNSYMAFEAPYVKTIIINGEGTTKLSLPYTPRPYRLPDYDGIYEAIKAVEESMGNRKGAVE
ncbi:MAG: MBL fold metallo-hydrolase [Ruminococcaceae bacterium]|nr:MBL fold metallo-hydrolase [Oscillospiraceae bacterium]